MVINGHSVVKVGDGVSFVSKKKFVLLHGVYKNRAVLFYWTLRAQCDVLVFDNIPKERNQDGLTYSTFGNDKHTKSQRIPVTHTHFHTVAEQNRDVIALWFSTFGTRHVTIHYDVHRSQHL